MPTVPGNEPRKSKVPVTRQRSVPAGFALDPSWRQIFFDDFRASHLNLNRWWTRYVYQNGYLDYLNDEQQRYRENLNHIQGNSSLLQLTAYPQGEDGLWASGMIRSRDIYPIHNGQEWYFECKGLVPRPRGIWPAFWLAGCETVPGDDSSCLWPPELDIMEIVNNGAEDTTKMLHCSCKVLNWNTNPQKYTISWCTTNFNPEWGTWWAPYDFADAMHLWSVWYKRPDYTIYCDRQPIVAGQYDWVFDNNETCPGCYILANLAIGGSWAGRHGVANEEFPCSFNLDYIKVWTRMPQSTIGHDLVERRD